MKTLQRTLMAIGLAYAMSNTTFAQEETPPPESSSFQPAMEAFSFGGAMGAPVVISGPVMSSPMPMLGFTMSESEDYSFMHDPSVRKDLELVGKQYKQFVKLSKKHQKAIQKLTPEFMKSNNDPERMQELQAEMAELQKQFQESVGDVLLPHQRDRYQQVARQMQMKMVGMGNAVQHGFLARELNISDSQKEKLTKIQVELQKQLQETNKKLRAEAKEKALQVLTIKQRNKIDELMGDEFKQDHNDWREELEKMRKQRETKETSPTEPASNDG